MCNVEHCEVPAPAGSNGGKQDGDGAAFGAVGRGRGGRRLLPGDDVVGALAGGVDPAAPFHWAAAGALGELEIQRLPVGVEDEVDEESFVAQLRGEGDAV